MKNIPFLFQFFLFFFICLCVALGVHYFAFSLASTSAPFFLLGNTYMLLFISTFLIVGIIYALRKKLYNQIGFLFLGGSLLKFALYFLFLNPVYQQYNLPKRQAFLIFFIPYLISLITEAVYVSKLLKNSPNK